ncbi:MAG TPA: cytochrome c3 family protein [Spirochaetota bacterium]|nr:cytochrome c3 family protein [Spirochaetota bacterium]HPJ35979.1 cytochrome c3 family protein [Spirochaetota bacterium]
MNRHNSINKLFRSLTFVFITVTAVMHLVSCSDTTSATDVVTITEVNRYFTGSDAQWGKKTLETTIHVKMPHSTHENSGVQCETCHHKLYNEERIKKCAWCHKGLAGAKTFHTFCVKCHTENSKGPLNCDQCHVEKNSKDLYKDIEKIYGGTFTFGDKDHKAHDDAAVKCDTCHHDGGDNVNRKKCDACHVGKSKMVVFHYFCKDCHKKNGGAVKCGECHAGVESGYQGVKDIISLEKTGRRLPRIQFNHRGHVEEYNTECVDCHHLGSIAKCSSCHGKKDEGAVINLKAAFHQQCHECHLRTAGPKGCHSCHRERD